MKGYVLVDMLVVVSFALGKVPVPELRTCHFCLLEDPSVGCISGSEKCTVSSSSPCMVISIYYDGKVRFNIRGCGRLNSYHCQERHSTYLSQYWYQAECCQYDYCNSWASPQLGGTPPEPSGEPLALPLSHTQARQLQRTLSLSSPLPGFHASTKKQSEGLGLGLSLAALQRMYLFFNSSGLLVLPGTGS